MPRRPGERLVSAWVPSEFKDAVVLLAAATDRTQSDLLREGLAAVAMSAAQAAQADQRG